MLVSYKDLKGSIMCFWLPIYWCHNRNFQHCLCLIKIDANDDLFMTPVRVLVSQTSPHVNIVLQERSDQSGSSRAENRQSTFRHPTPSHAYSFSQPHPHVRKTCGVFRTFVQIETTAPMRLPTWVIVVGH